MVIALLCVSVLALPQEPAPDPAPKPKAAPADDEFVRIIEVALPKDAVLEVGGLAPRGDELFVATRRGEIWRLQNAYSDAPKCTKWAEGLQEPLGLIDHDGWLWCSQRGELSKMRDRDGDGRMDELVTVSSGWPISGNYHEYCFGPALAPDGMWLTLNKPFGDEPFGRADFRGWAIRVDPKTGAWTPVCAGLRSPCGVGTSPWGEVFYSDNQGEWCATSKFVALHDGEFHGHPWGIESCKLPASKVKFPGEVKSGMRQAEAARTLPDYRLPAVWLPYDIVGRSPGNFVWDAAGHFGPYKDQVLCGDQWSAEVFRMTLEKVGGRWQGACYPFRRGLKCGITRVEWGTDGSLWCGLTNRGWGSLGQSEHGLQRIQWLGKDPFDLVEVTALHDGFRLRFTQPVNPASLVTASFAVECWTYDLHEGYGCPPRDKKPLTVRAAKASGADGKSVDLLVDGITATYVHQIACEGLRNQQGRALWHPTAYYTLNQIP
jgi:hypothetical protein